jgi:predicted MPP superfamily phosphohydrolase
MLQPLVSLVLSFLFLSGVGVYLTRRMIWPLHLALAPRRSLTGILILLLSLAFTAPTVMFISRKGFMTLGFANLFQSWAFPLMGFFSFLITVLIIEDILIIFRKTLVYTLWTFHFRHLLAKFSGSFHFLRKNYRGKRLGRALVLGAASVLFMIALQNGYTIRYPEITVPVVQLPEAFEGFRIALLTDVHIGPVYHRDDLQKMVNGINRSNVDLVAIVGDIADGMPENLAEEIAPLKDLKAKNGVLYVTGNHEYYWDGKAWMDAIQNIGIEVLFNSAKGVRRGASTLAFGGVPDIQAQRFLPEHKIDLEKTFREFPHTAETSWILLAHQPKVLSSALSAGVDLQLSGHTHGGQFFPWTQVVRTFLKYPGGLYHEGDTTLFVSTGAGSWGPPLRLGSDAEIPILTLQKKRD